jgi:hypothetical protein
MHVGCLMGKKYDIKYVDGFALHICKQFQNDNKTVSQTLTELGHWLD